MHIFSSYILSAFLASLSVSNIFTLQCAEAEWRRKPSQNFFHMSWARTYVSIWKKTYAMSKEQTSIQDLILLTEKWSRPTLTPEAMVIFPAKTRPLDESQNRISSVLRRIGPRMERTSGSLRNLIKIPLLCTLCLTCLSEKDQSLYSSAVLCRSVFLLHGLYVWKVVCCRCSFSRSNLKSRDCQFHFVWIKQIEWRMQWMLHWLTPGFILR